MIIPDQNNNLIIIEELFLVCSLNKFLKFFILKKKYQCKDLYQANPSIVTEIERFKTEPIIMKAERQSYFRLTIQNLGSEYFEFVYIFFKMFTHCFE